MVQLHVKVRRLRWTPTDTFTMNRREERHWPRVQRSQQQQFLYDASVEDMVKDVQAEIVLIHNLRQKIAKLKVEGAELAQYGASKQPDQQGIDTYADGGVEQGEHYKMDPTGRRTGNGAPSRAATAHHSAQTMIVQAPSCCGKLCLRAVQRATQSKRRCC